MARHLALALWITCAAVYAQCPPFQPSAPLDPGYHDEVIDAALMLMCCGQCSNNDDVMNASADLLNRLESGGLYQESGDGSWRAYTAPDTQCGGQSHWTPAPSNGIVINSSVFFDYTDPCALAVVLGAALLHEYVHCVTFVNSLNNETGEYDDPCEYYSNEQMCHMIELSAIDCMVSCGCAQCTGGGMNNIANRYNSVSDWLQNYTELLTSCH